MTLLEYFNTPETVLPQELIYGRLRVADAPFVPHQRVLLKLAVALMTHVEQQSAGEVLLAPTDVILDHDRALVMQPDLLFVSRPRLDIVRERIHGAPDLVVEILSPHPRIGAIDERVERFAAHGVREIWLYRQPERRMEILSCDGSAVASRHMLERGDRLKSSVLPRLTRTLESLVDLR